MVKEYNDNFIMVKIDFKENIGIYADRYLDFEVFSMEVGKYIIKRLQDNEKQGYKLIDFIKIINKNKHKYDKYYQ